MAAFIRYEKKKETIAIRNCLGPEGTILHTIFSVGQLN